MARKKNWYYIMVMTNDGPVLVTEILPNKYAKWDKEGKPLEFNKTRAEDIVYGLNLNLNMAFLVTSLYELDKQPYRYDQGKFIWKEKPKKKSKSVIRREAIMKGED